MNTLRLLRQNGLCQHLLPQCENGLFFLRNLLCLTPEIRYVAGALSSMSALVHASYEAGGFLYEAELEQRTELPGLDSLRGEVSFISELNRTLWSLSRDADTCTWLVQRLRERPLEHGRVADSKVPDLPDSTNFQRSVVKWWQSSHHSHAQQSLQKLLCLNLVGLFTDRFYPQRISSHPFLIHFRAENYLFSVV